MSFLTHNVDVKELQGSSWPLIVKATGLPGFDDKYEECYYRAVFRAMYKQESIDKSISKEDLFTQEFIHTLFDSCKDLQIEEEIAYGIFLTLKDYFYSCGLNYIYFVYLINKATKLCIDYKMLKDLQLESSNKLVIKEAYNLVKLLKENNYNFESIEKRLKGRRKQYEPTPGEIF